MNACPGTNIDGLPANEVGDPDWGIYSQCVLDKGGDEFFYPFLGNFPMGICVKAALVRQEALRDPPDAINIGTWDGTAPLVSLQASSYGGDCSDVSDWSDRCIPLSEGEPDLVYCGLIKNTQGHNVYLKLKQLGDGNFQNGSIVTDAQIENSPAVVSTLHTDLLIILAGFLALAGSVMARVRS